MQKTKTPLYIIGCLAIGIVTMLLVYMLLMFSGVLDVRATRLVIATGSAEKEYDGTPLQCDTWELVEGNLGIGHTISVSVNGTVTECGSVPNFASVVVHDASGADVTDEYSIEMRHGQLSVLGIKLVLRSPTVEKQYDGQPLSAPSYEFVSGRFLPDHQLGPVTVSGSITEPGEVLNQISATVVDGAGNDVSQNYNLVFENGVLRVTPIAITVTSGTMERLYNGEVLEYHEYTMSVGTLFGGDTMQVEFLRSRLEVGKVSNDIRVTIHDENGNDVTARYDIELILGHLAVVSEFGDHEDIDGDGLKDIFQDFDLDGIPDHWIDTDNDGKPDTPPGASGLNDSDGDGVIDMYDDDDNDGTPDILQDANGDGYPDHWTDENGDGIPDIPGIYSNLDDSGKIANDSAMRDAASEQVAVSVLSERTGNIYLRYSSFGNYDATTGSWRAAPVYERYDVSPLMFSAIALENAGFTPAAVTIYLNGKQHLDPYYNTTGTTSVNDVTLPLAASVYAMSYIPFNYVEHVDSVNPTHLGVYSSYESIYRNFVHQNYMSVPVSTRAVLETLIAEHDLWSVPSEQLVARIAEVIQNSATYNMDVEDPEEPCDIVAHFLIVSKEGLCRHFASAATLLYRAMGIPARYTYGYYGRTEAGVLTNLTGENAHAWVEVYIDGIGWMQVEVTAGYRGSDTNDQTGTGSETPGDSDQSPDYSPATQWGADPSTAIDITVQPYPVVSKPYDGTPLTSPKSGVSCTCDTYDRYLGHTVDCAVYTTNWLITSGGLNPGHRIELETSGSITEPGETVNWVVPGSIHIYDASNQDVTAQYNISYNQNQDAPAILKVTRLTVTIITGSSYARYTEGMVLTNGDINHTGTLADGHRLTYRTTGSQRTVGKSKNTATYVFYQTVNGVERQMSADEIQKYYDVKTQYGTLEIRMGELVIIVNGITKQYDGQPLQLLTTLNDVDLTELDPNHNFILGTNRSYTDVGQYYNTPGYTITDKTTGKVVTEQYKVTLRAGTNNGYISINAIPLSIKIDDAWATYDFDNPNQVLTSNSYTPIDLSGLMPGHRIESIVTSGSVSGIGETCSNTLVSYKIVDENGNDVSHCYRLVAASGTLEMRVPTS